MDEKAVETKVLSAMYHLPEVSEQLRTRSAGIILKYFLYSHTRRVAQATLTYFHEYGDLPPNRESLVKQIKRLNPELTETDFPTIDGLLDTIYEDIDPGHFEFLRDQLKMNYMRKVSMQQLDRSVTHLQSGNMELFVSTVLEIPRLISAEVDNIVRIDPVKKDVDRIIREIERLRSLPAEDRERNSIKTPIAWLNDRLDGGMLKGEHYLLFAYPGRGKSMSAADFAHLAALDGWKVVIFELEMSAIKMTHRIWSRRDAIPHRTFRRPWLLTDEQLERVRRSNTSWAERGLTLEIRSFKQRPTVESIEAEMMSLGFNPDLVIIDQLPDIAATFEWQNMAMIARDVENLAKSWCKEEGVVMLTFGQAKTPTEYESYLSMQDFAFGRGPCDYASVVMYLAQTRQDEEQDIIRFGICKDRDGASTREQEILYPRRDICRIHCVERAANEAPSSDDDDSIPGL